MDSPFLQNFEILRFTRSTFDSGAFITLPNQVLKSMEKQGTKHRSILPCQKILGKHFNAFNLFAGTADTFLKLFSLH